jgi:hypothetical protein
MQEVNYVEYDRYGNALNQTVDAYATEIQEPESLIDHRRISNEYNNLIAARRGNATTSTVARYDSLAGETLEYLIDRTVTVSSNFDTRGYAVDQVTDTYVVDRITDPENFEEKLATRRVVYNVEINNRGAGEATVTFHWLPRGRDNSDPAVSDVFTLAPGQSKRFENVLSELFGLEPDSLGALKLVSNTRHVIGVSRTYNIPGGKAAAGTFGQGLPAVRVSEMIAGTEPRHIIFLNEDNDSRANVGCVNGSGEDLRINIAVFDDEGSILESRAMELGPNSNDQINRVLSDWKPVNGSVDVWGDSFDALFYCYGSMLDNVTSDATTILPQTPSAQMTFIPAAALAAGLEGAFFQTDLDLKNVGSTEAKYEFLWLPRGADNSRPTSSDPFSLAAGSGARYANVLGEVFGLEADQVGALAVSARGNDLLAMSRTYNVPEGGDTGTFGQAIPGIPSDRMIRGGQRKRIIFMNENAQFRSNVGCRNGSESAVSVFVELFDSEGQSLEIMTMDLGPMSNNQITRVFRSHKPIEAGYVDIWSDDGGALFYCYGSVLDNQTSDPMTVLPQ